MLRFSFQQFPDGTYLLTNDAGRYLYVSPDEFMQCISDNITSVDLYKRLEENLFIDNETNRIRTKEALDRKIRKGDGFAIRYILKVTNYCNCNCCYCLSGSTAERMRESMSIETVDKAIDFILASDKHEIIIELQGGEPLSQFDTIKHINERIISRQNKWQNIKLEIMSNMTLLTKEMSKYINKYNIGIGSSLDGPKDIHDKHRPFANGNGSFDKQTANIDMHNTGRDHPVGALFTVTKDTMPKYKEIIDYYASRNQPSVFVRLAYNIGRAHTNWESVGYTGAEFVEFWKHCVDYIFELNDCGVDMFEQTTTETLGKIIHGSGNNIENTSPCGMLHEMIVVNWDGSIYSCDGGRMLADMGNEHFRLGSVYDTTYDQILASEKAKRLFMDSVIESKPNCAYCAYEPWCGKCPVEEEMYAYDSNTYLCEINKGIFNHIFDMLRDDEKKQRLMKWLDRSTRTMGIRE